jgi:hypothetical protein
MLDDSDLDAAVDVGLLDPAMRAKLVAFAADRRRTVSSPSAAPAVKFDPVHVLYYAGALLVMGAMGLFANSAFDKLGGWALAGIAAAYAVGFLWLGGFLWSRPGTRMPGGLFVAVAVSMVPLAIYGVQDALGLWAADKPKGYDEFYPLTSISASTRARSRRDLSWFCVQVNNFRRISGMMSFARATAETKLHIDLCGLRNPNVPTVNASPAGLSSQGVSRTP